MTQKCSRLILILFVLLVPKALSVDRMFEECAAVKKCGEQTISYPFWIEGQQESYCGYPGFGLTCKNSVPILSKPFNEYGVKQIFYNNQSVHVYNSAILASYNVCLPGIRNITTGDPRFEDYSNISMLNLYFECSLNASLGEGVLSYKVGCGEELGLVMFPNETKYNLGLARDSCERMVSAPIEVVEVADNYLAALTRGFVLKWIANNCSVCVDSGGNCGFDDSKHFRCFCPDRPHAYHCAGSRKINYKLILGAGIPGFVLLTLLVVIIWRRYKWKKVSSYFLSRNSSYDPSSRADIEGGGVFFGVPVFSYAELEEATNNFDPNKELGDGGFGTVYHGKLRDGREVAVKRLYEHNYKRVEQFKNEIEILTRLRHQNLVTLYGCTSRHSRELLLVYEYIPNGTVADHLHGDQATAVPLSWSVRMSIAIETATTLAYLHASDIIHRDVKTNNILLDNNFCVKVADFGLSRLFPTDVTHVSTAPQGTPGYVDPEYHQCYQLTDKSDVYSFGVVLIELISSLPAVDIARHRHEINLANLAVNRIQNRALNELIDLSLGFESDGVVQRMTSSVAELAFQCLQYDREMRPTMFNVLETLREIQGQECDNEKTEKGSDSVEVLKRRGPPPSPESDDVVLLKIKERSPSPVAVTDNWISRSTTSSTIG